MPRDLSSEVYILADTKFVAVQHCSEFRFDSPQTRRMIVCRGHIVIVPRESCFMLALSLSLMDWEPPLCDRVSPHGARGLGWPVNRDHQSLIYKPRFYGSIGRS